MTAIALLPWNDHDAHRVLGDLDMNDRLEAAIWRGDDADPLGMFADWRMARACTWLALAGGTVPFAILGVMPTGSKGVAQAALLARDHHRFRRELARLAVTLRAEMPGHAGENGLTRIECRCWSEHPTAARLLTAIGFRAEADLPGYGGGGAVFRQFAWIPETET